MKVKIISKKELRPENSGSKGVYHERTKVEKNQKRTKTYNLVEKLSYLYKINYPMFITVFHNSVL